MPTPVRTSLVAGWLVIASAAVALADPVTLSDVPVKRTAMTSVKTLDVAAQLASLDGRGLATLDTPSLGHARSSAVITSGFRYSLATTSADTAYWSLSKGGYGLSAWSGAWSLAGASGVSGEWLKGVKTPPKAVPAPEPSSLLLFSAAAGLFVRKLRRKTA